MGIAHAEDKPWVVGVPAKEQDAALALYQQGNALFDPTDPTKTVTLAYIRHFDGTGWSTAFSMPDARLRAIWVNGPADAIAVGDYASTGLNPTTVVRLDATGWAPDPALPLDTAPHLYGAWSSGAEDVFVAGQAGVIVHHDGAAWLPQETPAQPRLTALGGSGPRDVYAVGTGGAIWRYTGP